jgi:hypothetical protein
MKKNLLTLLFLTSFSSFAQYTLIPDLNFEKALIDKGIDTGSPDGKVLTASINNLNDLEVSSKNITDLTGIQDFKALRFLYCGSNQLTSLDVSQNTALILLFCGSNQLTSLDVSKNIVLEVLLFDLTQITSLDISKNLALTQLYCHSNQLTSLDVSKNIVLNTLYCPSNQLTNLDISKNTALKDLVCNENKLTSLDISKNTALTRLYCPTNQLTYLNLKNGNNTNFDTTYRSNFKSNPNLSCIQVDDVSYSNTLWADFKDANATYNTTCPTLGIEESIFASLSLYPIPAKEVLHIDNITLEKATLYDALGRQVKTAAFNNTTSNTIPVSNLPKGMYYIYLQSEGATAVRKVSIE